MKITSINQNYTQNIQNFVETLPHISSQVIINKSSNDNFQSNELNINILNNLLDDLVNNVHTDDNHPLARPENSPIEFYKDALNELIKTTNSIPVDGNLSQNKISANMLIDLLSD
jgi:hypothetical protein